jgi:hypothetical protein
VVPTVTVAAAGLPLLTRQFNSRLVHLAVLPMTRPHASVEKPSSRTRLIIRIDQ